MFKTIISIFKTQRQETKKPKVLSEQQLSPVASVLHTDSKLNKFEPISAKPFLDLAQRSPSKAAQKLRERYPELSDFTNSSAMPCIYWDNIEDWDELAKILIANDIVLAKTIYTQLLFVRNSSQQSDQTENHIPNFDKIALELYNLEKLYPDLNPLGRLETFSRLMSGGSPSTPFWQEVLEETFDIAASLTKPEKAGYIILIAQALFYAEKIPELKDRFSTWISVQLDAPKFLADEPRPAWNKGYLFGQINSFCIQENTYVARNISFSSNPKAATNLLLIEKFWGWFDHYNQKASYEALEMLQHAVHSNDKQLSAEASDVYIKSFSAIAKKEPLKASECLRNILRYSGLRFGNINRKDDAHQVANLCRIFDETIVMLQSIDNNAAILVFYEFCMSSHSRPPDKMFSKYASEIGMAHLHRKEKLSLK